MNKFVLCALFVLASSLVSGGNDVVDQYLRSDGSRLLPEPELFDEVDLFAARAWHYQALNFSNPMGTPTDKNTCRVNGTISDNNVTICDPDTYLTTAQLQEIHNKIKNALDAQYCLCSPCTKNNTYKSGRYSISIAIGGYFVNPSVADNPTECSDVKVPTFANALRENRWQEHQQCEDGVFFAYSPEDRVISTVASRRARSRMDTSCINAIHDKLKAYLDEKRHFELVSNLIDYYKHALRGGKCGEKSGLTQDQVIAITCGVIFGLGGLILIIVLCVGFFRNWKCIAASFLGIIIGAILKAIQIAINVLIIKCMNAICERFRAAIPACEEPCACCQCEPLTCVEDVEAGGGGGGGW